MPLKKDQYAELMRIYDRRKREDEEELEKRKKLLYERVPELLKIQDAYAANASARARAMILGSTDRISLLDREALELKRQR